MLSDQVKADMTQAMKAGDRVKLSTLRMLLSELGYKQIEVQRELTDEDVVAAIRSAVKKRKEAMESYKEGGRSEQAAAEETEMKILESYLPAQMSEEEIRARIAKIKELEGVVDMGTAMKVVSPMFKGKADMSLVSKMVKEKLDA